MTTAAVPQRIVAPRFTEADADRAYEEWGANCGPGALAAMVGLTLDEVRPHLRGFEGKGYTNPTMMYDALNSIGVRYDRYALEQGRREWPRYGLVRVQWGGPWLQPNVPRRARYRYTHWIGTAIIRSDRGIFDVNALNNGSGWCALEQWKTILVPHLIAQYKRADGTWSGIDAIEVVR